ncbi:MAG: hypothetical protein RLW61_15995 [Gammaproteobacteria bacterium]
MRDALALPRKTHPFLALVAATALTGSVAAAPTTTPRLVQQQALEQTINFSTLTVRDGRISAVVENRGERVIDDIVVMVRYNWLWKDEDDPGPGHPGWVEYVTLDEQLAPGARVPFVYSPREPLPQRDDGWFMPTAAVVGATIYAARE